MAVTRADLPQFMVSSVEQTAGADSEGYAEWRLSGELSRTEGVTFDGWSFLLISGHESLVGEFTPPNAPSRTTFTTLLKERPEVLGLKLACLGPYWNPYQVWTVEDGPNAWTEGVFAASDVEAEYVEGTDGRRYHKLSKLAEPKTSSFRLQPTEGNQLPSRIVPEGWDHEHCEICNSHIDPGDKYFHHAEDNAFLCVSCYEKYVLRADIGFALPVPL